MSLTKYLDSRQYPWYILFITVLFLASCGTSSRVSKKTGGKAIEEGVASWYGPKFHGKLTANGEVYNMYSMTAAHRTLPFNTFLRVKNLENERSVVVRINDRGPFAKNRIIDLSKKAAAELDIIGAGTARVKLYVVGGEYKNRKPKNLKVPTFTIQIGSFNEKKLALKRSNKVKGARVEKAYLNGGDAVYRVYYGTFTNKKEAEKARRKLARKGYRGYIKQLEN